MEDTQYERPREKLRLRGVGALSSSELLQVIIGSGTKSLPVARLAKRVHQQLLTHGVAVTCETLTKVPGIGYATAYRIIAALRIGTHYSNLSAKPSIDVQKLLLAKKRQLLYAWYDGASTLLGSYSVDLNNSQSSVALAKRICAQVLASGGYAVHVAIGYKNQPSQPDVFELGLLHDLKQVTQLLQIKLLSFELVNQAGRYVVYKGSA